MSELRQEIKDYVDAVPDYKLPALKQLLTLISSEPLIIESDLTEEEKAIIAEGMEAYKRGGFIALEDAKKALQ